MKLDPQQPIIGVDTSTIGDFWAWAYSDIMNNTRRGEFAEFVVASALGVTDTPRIGWDSVDLRYMGKGVEVKCSAFLQTWQQTRLSRITFGIGVKRAWNPITNVMDLEPTRSADCYVFCLYPEQDAKKANLLDIPTWLFYVLSTGDIVQTFGTQKSVTLARLENVCEAVRYSHLKARIDEVLGGSEL